MTEPEHGVTAEPAAPTPAVAGTFAIYQDSDGGLVLVADIVGRGPVRRKVPAAMVQMMTGERGGVVGKLLRRTFGSDE